MNKVKAAAALKGIDNYNGDFSYSDHASSVFPLKTGVDVFCWNILTKCRYENSVGNNAFSVHEDDSEYRDRLLEIAERIKKKLNDKIAVIALQEAPKVAGLLALLLPDGWKIAAHSETQGITSALATFYNPAVLSFVPAALPEMNGDLAYYNVLPKQASRYHVLKTGDLSFVNAHFRHLNKGEACSQFDIICYWMRNACSKMAVMGDFNDEMVRFQGRKIVNTGGSYKNNKKLDGEAVAKIDMALYNYDPLI